MQLDITDFIGGATFDPDLDGERLGDQMIRVLSLMQDGKWRTLREIANQTDDPEDSISARLRDVRKKWGEYAMESRRRPSVNARRGVWEYRVVPEEAWAKARVAA